tara:strand:- start:2323 stop:2637 length:315 start_codon:yes stop_codon:yes gene_type:complete
MIEKKLKSGRKVKIRELSVDKIDELKDIIKMKYHKDGSTVVENLNVARTAWIRAGLGGGEFKNWKPNGAYPPDSVLKQLSDVEREELFDLVQSSQIMGEEAPSN